jgi:hypothetical protein
MKKPETIFFFEIDSIYTSDTDIYLCNDNYQIIFNPDNLFHWLNSLIEISIEQRNEATKETIKQIKSTIKDLKQ